MSGVYVTGALLAVTRAALGDLDAADQIQSRIRADYVSLLPYVHVRGTIGGGDLIGPDLRTVVRAPFQIDCYATEARDAHVLAGRVVDALNQAWFKQTVTSSGSISRVQVTGVSDFPESDRADGVARAFATGFISVRPPA